MKRTLLRDLKKHVGEDVSVGCFVEKIRPFGHFRFLVVRDRSGIGQAMLPTQIYSQKITLEDVLLATGKVAAQPQSRYDGVELAVTGIELLSSGESGARIVAAGKNALSLDTLLDKRPATIRDLEIIDLFRMQSEIVRFFSEYLHAREFVEVKTPKIIGSSVEGGSKVFKIDYFGRNAFLAQSPQLYHQMVIGAFERVFEIGPAFRAEEYATSRHVNEFTSLDAEMGFIKDQRDLTDLVKNMLIELFKRLNKGGFVNDAGMVDERGIADISYEDAVEKLGKPWGTKLSGEDKRKIGQWYEANARKPLVIISGLPEETMQFYTMPDRSEDPGRKKTRSFKALYRGQEVCSGGQRIHDYNLLLESLQTHGLDPHDFADYLYAFECGLPPHGGFCIGINRLTGLLGGRDNVKEAVLFPRDPKRLLP